ncbi:MAG TPA: c-type cytochrome [Terracidiphilus sp.]|jgi:mono/diheme cytochrome c family protein|nr:c-type cytochrome [Terracidiphilus sp.]
MRRGLAVVLAFAVVSSAAVAVQQSHFLDVPAKDHAKTNPLAGKTDAVPAGARLYADHCAQCHHADAQGDGRKKPSLRTPRVRSATDGDLEWFLRQGDLRHGMPSWSSLTQAQRWAIIRYLRSLQ